MTAMCCSDLIPSNEDIHDDYDQENATHVGRFKMVAVMVTVVMSRVTVVVLVLFAGPDDISFFKQILFAIYSIFETPHFTRNYICGLPNPTGFLPRNRAN